MTQSLSERAVLTIDLKALCDNYRSLNALSGQAECAAVIKANAYGIGLEQAASALLQTGCQTFFVASLDEARRLRKITPSSVIYVLDGLFPETSEHFAEFDLRPVLNSLENVQEWSAFCIQTAQKRPAAVHTDTGMNRLGLAPDDFINLKTTGIFDTFTLSLLMSHLACGDEPDHPMNRKQLEKFKAVRGFFLDIPASFANSAGIFLGPDYHFDLVRAGIAMYGGRARVGVPNSMKPVAHLQGRIAQIRTCQPGESVGYSATETLNRVSRIATITTGYADGYSRHLSSNDQRKGGHIYVGDQKAPLVGRVSMDLITADVTDIPEHKVTAGSFVELLGHHILVDDLADIAGTIGYEILTNLGARYKRIYKE